MYTEEAEEALLSGHPDFVLDAIDNINTKVWRGHISPRISTMCRRVACLRIMIISLSCPAKRPHSNDDAAHVRQNAESFAGAHRGCFAARLAAAVTLRAAPTTPVQMLAAGFAAHSASRAIVRCPCWRPATGGASRSSASRAPAQRPTPAACASRTCRRAMWTPSPEQCANLSAL